MDKASESLHLRRLLGLALLLQLLAVVIPGPTLVPYPPKYYPLAQYLIADFFFGLSLVPLLVAFRRGHALARTAALLLCIPLSIHIVHSFHANARGFYHEWFPS